MGKQTGRAFILQIGDGQTPQGFATIASLVSRDIDIDSESIDVTTPPPNPETDPMWCDLLSGKKSMKISADGVFDNEDSQDTLESIVDSTEPIRDITLIIPGANAEGIKFRVKGKFFFTTYKLSAASEAEGQFSLEITSIGKIHMLAETQTVMFSLPAASEETATQIDFTQLLGRAGNDIPPAWIDGTASADNDISVLAIQLANDGGDSGVTIQIVHNHFNVGLTKHVLEHLRMGIEITTSGGETYQWDFTIASAGANIITYNATDTADTADTIQSILTQLQDNSETVASGQVAMVYNPL